MSSATGLVALADSQSCARGHMHGPTGDTILEQENSFGSTDACMDWWMDIGHGQHIHEFRKNDTVEIISFVASQALVSRHVSTDRCVPLKMLLPNHPRPGVFTRARKATAQPLSTALSRVITARGVETVVLRRARAGCPSCPVARSRFALAVG